MAGSIARGSSADRRVAIVGAGIAGLACAERLRGAGLAVEVFEKSRGVSGRMSTRRLEGGLAFDHGAQYFTARDEVFAARITQWVADGVAAPWAGAIAELRGGVVTPKSDGELRYVGTPDMPAVCRSLAEGLPVRLGTRVGAATRRGGAWRLTSDKGDPLGEFDTLLLTIPPPQAAVLLGDAESLRQRCEGVTMQGCWTVMAAFSERLDPGFDGAFVNDSPLSWVARSSGKPARAVQADAWVLHAGHEWSDEHIEREPDPVGGELLAEFWRATGLPPRTPSYQTTHRWRYAIPAEPLAERCLFDPDLAVGVAGDWCGGPRVEGAYLSGAALAERVLSAWA